jgi:hypothetical protein
MSSKGRAREGLFFGASNVFVSSKLLLAAGLFRSAERVTFIQIHKSNQKVSLSGYRPNVSFTLFKVAFSNTIFIVRHRLFICWEIDHQALTLKRHKVAQLRRVERTSPVMLFFVGHHERSVMCR